VRGEKEGGVERENDAELDFPETWRNRLQKFDYVSSRGEGPKKEMR